MVASSSILDSIRKEIFSPKSETLANEALSAIITADLEALKKVLFKDPLLLRAINNIPIDYMCKQSISKVSNVFFCILEAKYDYADKNFIRFEKRKKMIQFFLSNGASPTLDKNILGDNRIIFAHTTTNAALTEFLVKDCGIDVNLHIPARPKNTEEKDFSNHIVITALGYSLQYWLANPEDRPAIKNNIKKLIVELNADIKLALVYILRLLNFKKKEHQKLDPELVDLLRKPIEKMFREYVPSKEGRSYMKALCYYSDADRPKDQLLKIEAIDCSSSDNDAYLACLSDELLANLFDIAKIERKSQELPQERKTQQAIAALAQCLEEKMKKNASLATTLNQETAKVSECNEEYKRKLSEYRSAIDKKQQDYEVQLATFKQEFDEKKAAAAKLEPEHKEKLANATTQLATLKTNKLKPTQLRTQVKELNKELTAMGTVKKLISRQQQQQLQSLLLNHQATLSNMEKLPVLQSQVEDAEKALAEAEGKLRKMQAAISTVEAHIEQLKQTMERILSLEQVISKQKIQEENLVNQIKQGEKILQELTDKEAEVSEEENKLAAEYADMMQRNTALTSAEQQLASRNQSSHFASQNVFYAPATQVHHHAPGQSLLPSGHPIQKQY